MGLIRILVLFLRGVLRNRTELAAENLALRQQLAILQQKSKTPRLRRRDRIFWALLSRIWADWRAALLIVQPDTVVRWHREGFRLFWRWKSRTGKVGRPKIKAEIRNLIRRMSRGIRCGERLVFNQNSRCWAMLSPSPPSTSTEFTHASRHLKRGEPSWTTMFATSSPSTSLPSPPRRSASCSFSSCSVMTDVTLSTST